MPLGLALAALGILLALLAALQLRWTDELTRMARASLEASLRDLGGRAAEDIERELAKALPLLAAAVPGDGTVPEPALIAARQRLRDESIHPAALDDFWVADAVPPCNDASRLASDAVALAEVSCPGWLQELVAREQQARAESVARGTRRRSVLFSRSPPALVIGIWGEVRGERDVVRWLVLRYAEAEIRDGLLQDLLRRAGEGRRGAADEAVVFEPELRVEGPQGPGPWRRFDGGGDGQPTDALAAVRLPLLQFFPLDEVRRRAEESATAPAIGEDSGFRLAVRLPAGPLEAVVQRNRQRNLWVGFGVLAVLGAASVALVTLARRAERLADERLRFVAGVTHELRTPVASIRSLADNLADGLVGDPERLRTYGGQIRREAERLGDLVEDTLLIGGLRAAASAQDRELVSLAEATRSALHGLSHRLASYGVRIEVHWGEDGLVRGRRAAIERAIANLIENGAKFSPAGGTIRLTTETRSTGPDPEVRLTIADQGPGFADDERASVFEPFFRGREAIARSLPGSGLGLAVVRETATALSGRVEIGEGPGGAVTLAFPLVAPDTKS